MKRLFSVFAFLFLSTFIFAQTVRLGSWNMERLDGNPKKDYATLAKVIEKEFDVVGCIEVMNPLGVAKIMTFLGPEWKSFVAENSVGTKVYKEYYGYIWNSQKVTMVKPLGYFPNQPAVFVRQPYGAHFQSGKLDFTLILSHIIYGTGDAVRRAEIAHLGEVVNYFLNLDPNDKDVILSGDFNEASKEAFSNLLGINGEKDAFDFSLKTTLGFHGPASDYDHMFINQYTQPRLVNKGEYDYVPDFVAGDYKKGRETVSDHLPVFAEIKTEP
jgi:hypothetical protein